MDFVNKAYAAILDLFKSMTPATRVTTGLLLAVIVISTMFLFQGSLTSIKTNLFPGHDLRLADIAKIESAFSLASLNDYEVKGGQILVPQSKRAEYNKAIADNNALPAGVRDDAYQGSSIFESQSDKEDRRLHKKKLEIKRLVEDLSTVHRAQVSVDQSAQGPMQTRVRTCTVIASPQGGDSLTSHTMQSIVRIVKGAFSGIDVSNIQVTDRSTGRSLGGDTLTQNLGGGLLSIRKRETENDYRKKILGHLISYGDVQVDVEAELDPTIGTVTLDKDIRTTPVPIQQNSTKVVVSSRGAAQGGAPGTRSQQPNASANGSAVAGGQTMSKEETTESVKSVAGTTLKQQRVAGFKVKKVTASIGISAESVRKAYYLQNPTPEGEEKKPVSSGDLKAFFDSDFRIPIQDKVAKLLGGEPDPGKTMQDNVVVMMDFEIELDPVPGTPITTTILTWVSNNWQSVGLMFFGVFAIVALRSMVTSAIADTKPGDEAEQEFGSILPPPVDLEEQEIVVQRADGTTTVVKRKELDEQAEDESIEKANQLLDRFQNRQPTLREELTELVEADLDAAASVLKTWIGDP